MNIYKCEFINKHLKRKKQKDHKSNFSNNFKIVSKKIRKI